MIYHHQLLVCVQPVQGDVHQADPKVVSPGEIGASTHGVKTESMDHSQRERLEELIHDFRDVFCTGKHDLGRIDEVYHRINTEGAALVRQSPRRVPIHRRHDVGRLIEDMQREAVIQPSKSPWAFPMVMVQKKDGSTPFCVDYRKLNDITRKDSYPLPRVDGILDSLAGSQWFSTLDLASGYWQVEVDPDDLVVVLAGLRWEIFLAYLDDIVVFGRTFEEHLQRLRVVLSRLREANLKVNPKKCQLFQCTVSFSGACNLGQGFSTDKAKVDAVQK